MGCTASGPLDSTASELIQIESRRRASDDFELFLEKDLGASQFGTIRKCRVRATVPAQKLPPTVTATHSDLINLRFAMKTVVKSRCRSRDDPLREARVMMGLSQHPHILPLIAVYDEPEQTHFVLRLCSNVTLFDICSGSSYTAISGKMCGC